jgi:hypothetical protein
MTMTKDKAGGRDQSQSVPLLESERWRDREKERRRSTFALGWRWVVDHRYNLSRVKDGWWREIGPPRVRGELEDSDTSRLQSRVDTTDVTSTNGATYHTRRNAERPNEKGREVGKEDRVTIRSNRRGSTSRRGGRCRT